MLFDTTVSFVDIHMIILTLNKMYIQILRLYVRIEIDASCAGSDINKIDVCMSRKFLQYPGIIERGVLYQSQALIGIFYSYLELVFALRCYHYFYPRWIELHEVRCPW